MRWRALLFALTVASAARAEPSLDLGARAGLALPAGAFDQSTRAGDLTFGGTPLGIDAAVALDQSARWRVEPGILLLYTPTSPRLCGSTSECVSSIGRDLEADVFVRFRGPRWGRIAPEAEVGFGWSWSKRELVDSDAVSTRSWSGPVVLRVAAIPTFRLGSRFRLGIVVGGSLARSSSAAFTAPGLERHDLGGAAFHGTFELGVRFGLDLFSRAGR